MNYLLTRVSDSVCNEDICGARGGAAAPHGPAAHTPPVFTPHTPLLSSPTAALVYNGSQFVSTVAQLSGISCQ